MHIYLLPINLSNGKTPLTMDNRKTWIGNWLTGSIPTWWKNVTSHYREPFNLLHSMFCTSFFVSIFHYLSVFDYTDCPCFEVKDEEDLLLEKTVRGYKTGRGISTGLRHIFAIVSPQISTMMEPCNAILEHEPANRR